MCTVQLSVSERVDNFAASELHSVAIFRSYCLSDLGPCGKQPLLTRPFVTTRRIISHGCFSGRLSV
jgi:hypothetical protein